MTDAQILERAETILAGLLAKDGFELANPNNLVLHASIRLRAERREVLLGYWFDQARRLIGVEELATGGEGITSFSLHEVVRRAVLADARAVAFIHNHPGETNLSPSETDKDAARQLSERFAVLGILAVHFVVSPVGAVNIMSGERSAFTYTPATPAAALCPSCGSQALPSQTQEPT